MNVHCVYRVFKFVVHSLQRAVGPAFFDDYEHEIREVTLRKLFLHLGTHKTGTTSFQAYLADNRVRIRSQGVAVFTEKHPKLGLMGNCFSLPNTVLRPALMTIARMTGTAKKPSFWQHVKSKVHVASFLSDRTATRFVLSAEGFCFARESAELTRIKTLLSAPDLEVVPVVCLRDDERWRASWLAQVERLQPQYLLPHGQGINDIRGDWYFDKREILRFWEQIGPVRTVDYDAAVSKHGTIIPALLAAMELEDCGGSGDYFLNVGNEATTLKHASDNLAAAGAVRPWRAPVT